MNNKKGISAIVATVLIILITVAAVTIIWAAIIPMVSTNLEKGQVCLDASSGGVAILDEGYTCKNSSGDYVSLQIKHGSKDFNLDEIQVIVSGGGNSKTFDLKNVTGQSLPGINEEWTYTIDRSNFSSTFSSMNLVDEIQIAPIVKVGGRSTETCDVVASLKINEC